jgi:hypothetical protein
LKKEARPTRVRLFSGGRKLERDHDDDDHHDHHDS